MKTKDLIQILSSLPEDLEVKMYLFTEIPRDPTRLGGTILSCDVFDIHDVLVSSYGNSVLLSSNQ